MCTYRKFISSVCLIMVSVAVAAAQEGGPSAPKDDETAGSGGSEAKMVSGMSVLGNKEAPMSLFIVPWKGSELGAETNLTRTLNERHVPVDRDVFLRELSFYQASVGSESSVPASRGFNRP